MHVTGRIITTLTAYPNATDLIFAISPSYSPLSGIETAGANATLLVFVGDRVEIVWSVFCKGLVRGLGQCLPASGKSLEEESRLLCRVLTLKPMPV
jgi:hypothetical protein